MLLSLAVRDIILIDQLDLDFHSGLNVLTGETGAGKSILLDALGFALGHRGRADLVRTGAAQGEVVAEFALTEDSPIHEILEQAGLPDEGDSLILRRVNSSEGRKTAYVNDRRCSGEILRQLSAHLVEIHGQHDDRGLLDPKGHRALLDSYAGADVERTGAAWTALTQARRALKAEQARIEALASDEDFMRHAIGELDALSPEQGEDEALDIRRRQMQAAERVREDVAKAEQALGGQGAEGPLTDALRWLEAAAAHLETAADAPVAAIERALTELSDAQSGVAALIDSLDADPLELERVEERLFAIRALARKHDVLPDALPELADQFRSKLQTIDNGAGRIAELEQAVNAAQKSYDEAASDLREARMAAARTLDKAMADELAPLKMERAVFTTQFEDAPDGPDGRDTVTFTVATNPGAPSGPINKIASGGELSRFLLALKVCLTTRADGLTMIFDEIDRGVGGATADAVGRRLEKVAAQAQVLVVTHSPQVAARGAHHWRIAKSVEAGVTTTRVTPLGDDDRTEEVARMLSGDTVTPEARSAAEALLKG
ncbi:DNA repair protein RecN [Pontivivens insulae]|uniref:DNA repair protein RecN n=1 Tax=Pontivivens insulae TaxID=1639689 RepID=A0A2R8ADZ5_9RHOB|nr:DNA repair protein RecN [Pontivivens insulae]RED14210.1 DNA replication and repair protein RecN [Pontivivens insulae]SPF30285.1 DNA repair protein RecN [Pontivivens insulae]